MDEEDRRRYFVVGSVILEVAQPLFRKRLEDIYTTRNFICLQDFLTDQQVIHVLFHLRNRNTWCCKDSANCVNNQRLPLYKKQWDRLYTSTQQCQKNLYLCHCKYTANPVQTSDLDITLAGLILLNCCNLAPPEEQAVFHIRQYKNDYLSHNTDVGLSEAEFNTLWPNLRTFILQLDPSKEDDFIRIQNRPMDGPLCNKYNSLLLEIHKRIEEMEAKLEIKLEKILNYSQRCAELLEGQSVKDTIQPYRLGEDIFTLHHQTDLIEALKHQIDLTDVLHTECKRYIWNGMMMDDGRLVLVIKCTSFYHKQGTLLIYKTDESSVDSIPLQYGPFDVTAVNNSTVAVMMGSGSDCIEIYDINSKNKLKSIQVPVMLGCSFITTINNKLVVSGTHCLKIIDPQTGNTIKTIDTPVFVPGYVRAVNDKIFYCNDHWSYDKKLYCYNYSSNKLSTVTLPSPPYRITSLQDGSLYVVCIDASVHHVKSDVQHYNKVKLLLSILTPLYKIVAQYKTVTTVGLESVRDCGMISYNSKQRKLITFTKGGLVKVFNEM